MNGLYANRRVRVRHNTVTHVKRHLPPGKGKIDVIVGQEVSPIDVLGEGQPAVGFRTVHLAKELNVSPKQALNFLKRDFGKVIYDGELLASKNEFLGLQKKIILSPVDGIIDVYDQEKGNLRIKLLPKVTRVASGVYGVVDYIDHTSKFVIIRTLATEIFGIFGSGREREGTLNVLGSAETLVSSKQISSDMMGQVIVGGAMVFYDALEKMIGERIHGIIAGGINSKDYKAMVGGDWNFSKKRWSDVGLSLMVTEGFGAVAMGEDIFSVLKQFDKKFVILDGNWGRLILPTDDQNSIINIRNTKIPVEDRPESEPDLDCVPLEVGMKVRLIASPYVGLQGNVDAIDRSLTKLPSGIATYMITVATKSQKVRVPYLNLEVIG